jgi:hypothetical protein
MIKATHVVEVSEVNAKTQGEMTNQKPAQTLPSPTNSVSSRRFEVRIH